MQKRPLFVVVVSGGDSNSDGQADIHLSVHVMGAQLVDVRKDVSLTDAIPVVLGVVARLRGLLGV